MSVTIETFELGPMMTNCHVLSEGDDCWIVDPSSGVDSVVSYVSGAGLVPSRIVLTHTHADHIGGVES